MSKKAKKNKTKQSAYSAPKRPAGMSDEEYEEYLEITEAKKEAAAIEAERKKLKEKINSYKATAAVAAGNSAKETGSAVKSGFGKIGSALKKTPGRIKNSAVSAYRNLPETGRKLWAPFSRFGEKKYSFPVLFILIFVFYYLFCLHKGCNIITLDVHCITLHFYLADYSVGFCSRLLIGAVIGLFTDRVSPELISVLIRIAVCLTLLIQAAISGYVLKKALREKNLFAVLIVLMFVFNPLCIDEYLIAPGMIDTWQLLLFMLWLCTCRSPLVYLTAPLTAFAGMALHYSYVFNYFPPMMVILFGEAVLSQKKSARIRNGVSFASASVAGAGSFLWFVFGANRHLKMTSDEFYNHMMAKFDCRPSLAAYYKSIQNGNYVIWREYFDYYIFGDMGKHEGSEVVGGWLPLLKAYKEQHFNSSMLIEDLKLFVPVFLILGIFWVLKMKKESGFLRRLPYVLCIAQALVLIPEILMSLDFYRWFSAAIISQAAVYFMYFSAGSELGRDAG